MWNTLQTDEITLSRVPPVRVSDRARGVRVDEQSIFEIQFVFEFVSIIKFQTLTHACTETHCGFCGAEEIFWFVILVQAYIDVHVYTVSL